MISQKVLKEACTLSGAVFSGSPRSPIHLSKSPIPFFDPKQAQTTSIISPLLPEEKKEELPIFQENEPESLHEEKEKQEVVMVRAQPNKAPVIVDTNKICPCIVVTKTKEKRICGNKAKYDGRCGIHKNKCNLPAEKEKVAQKEKPRAPSPVRVPSPKQQPIPIKRVVEAEITEIKEQGTCQCLILRKGEVPRICGRKIKLNGRCGIHQKTCHLPEGAAVAPPPKPVAISEQQQPPTITCTCIIKKTKTVCGRKVLAGSDRCGRHQKTCFKVGIIEQARDASQASPLLPERAPETPESKALMDLAEDLDRAMEEEEIPVNLELTDPQLQPIEEEKMPAEWTELTISSLDELEKFTSQLKKQPTTNLFDFQSIEDQIRECLEIN